MTNKHTPRPTINSQHAAIAGRHPCRFCGKVCKSKGNLHQHQTRTAVCKNLLWQATGSRFPTIAAPLMFLSVPTRRTHDVPKITSGTMNDSTTTKKKHRCWYCHNKFMSKVALHLHQKHSDECKGPSF